MSQFPWILPALTLLLLAVSLLRSAVDWLNMRHGENALPPEEFASMLTEEKREKGKEYLSAQTRFGIFERTVWLAASLGFLWLGGFGWLDQVTAPLAGGSPILHGLFFFAGLGLLSEILSLPFSLYSTFVIEERFGFNRSTAKTFCLDQLKGLLLGVVIGGPVLAALLWFFLSTGEHAWVWAWGFWALFQLLVGFLAPVLLMPLFNKFTPLPEGNLKTAIEAYAASVNFRLQGIFTMDGSKRSAKANAFFTGFGKFRRIVLFDTLIAQHTTPELVAVLAHEVGHFKRGHILKGMILSLVSSFALFYFLSLVLRSQEISAAFGFQNLSVHGGLIAAVWLYGPISLLLGIGLSGLSRKHEFEADAFAVRTTGRGEDLVSALKRLSVENLSNLNPHPWKVWLEYSHPPVTERVRVIRALG